nr:reverse transcriptase domain-containing protein [Tanacetum cinerariifolium]
SGTPTEPHHTPFPEVTSSHPTTLSILLPSIPTAPVPTVTQTDTTHIIQYSRRSRITQSSTLPTIADEHASPVRDDSQGEACPTDSGFIADQDRATIAKSSTLPCDLAPRVTSPATKEGRETNVPTGSGFIPTVGPPATVISTGSEVGPTDSPIVTRRKGKEVMVESDTPKKKKAPGGPCRLCYNCQKPGHFARDCRAPVKNVVPINAVKMGNDRRVCYECRGPDYLRNTCNKLNRAPGQVTNCLTIEEDIQCASSDTRPPRLDRTDFASWQQRIRLYCRGPERPRVYYDLTSEEKDRFVTAVKVNRGLRDSNYDQLYAYLKQHEAHANENKVMLDQFTQHTIDLLALMSNVSNQQHCPQSFTTPPSTYFQPHSADTTKLDSGLSLTENLIKNLTNTLAILIQSYKTYLPQTNNQLRTLSNPRNQAIIQEGRVVIQNVQGRQNRRQGNNAWGAGAASYEGARNRENEVALDEEQLLFITGTQDKAVDEDVDEQPVQDLALNVDNMFQADDCDAFDFDVDEAPTAQTMFRENLS